MKRPLNYYGGKYKMLPVIMPKIPRHKTYVAGSSIENPSFTLIARMDKMPPYIVATEHGEFAIKIEEGDTEHMIKIKEFMAMYGIVDIKMRMLFIKELQRIQGFPEDYIFHGTQEHPKKQIGNAVEVNQAKAIGEAVFSKNVKVI